MPRVLIVESDAAYAGELARELTTRLPQLYRTPPIEITLARDGQAALDAATRQPPDLLLVCVELPTISGYSVCNKAKKNPLLKDTPLIIMSAEATPEIFEQHSKLRTPADAYLIKPFSTATLLERVASLLGLGDEGTQLESAIDTSIEQGFAAEQATLPRGDEAPAEAELELEIEDGDLVTDELGAMTPQPLPGHPAGELADQEISLATDAAFAALELPFERATPQAEAAGARQAAWGAPAPSVDPGATPAWSRSPAPTPLALDPPTDPNDALDLAPPLEFAPPLDLAPRSPIELGDQDYGERGGLTPSAIAEPLPGLAPAALAIDESLADEPFPLQTVAETVVSSGLAPLAAVALDETRDARAEEAERRVAALQQENDQLTQSLREANAVKPTTGGGLTRDRELLGLREVINKKERELLDLRDELDARERQILDHKDKVRELDRRARDMDEKLLGIEKEMVSARERAEALQQDKQRLVDRESGVKQRLEEAKREIEKAYAENTQVKERQERELARLKQQHGDELRLAEQRLTDEQTRLRAEHAAELRELAEELRREQQAEGSAHLKEIERREQEHRDEVTGLDARHQAEQQALREQHQQQLEQARQQHEQALATQQASARVELEQAAQRAEEALESQRTEQQAELARAAQQHQTLTAQARASHEEALQRVKQQHQDLLEQIETEHAEEKESLRGAHQTEIDQLRQQHGAAVSTLRGEHEAALDALRQQQARELKALVDEEQAKSAAFELTIAGQQEQLGELGALLESHELRLADALAALQIDAELGEKARRALAVAVALVDQQHAATSSAAAGERDAIAQQPRG
ncbi:MAG: response regulator [Proteobacteria bacterium]|nr:response regulator [Pseudomonadota bacterium]